MGPLRPLFPSERKGDRMKKDPVFFPLRVLSEWIQARKMSPVEITEIFLHRLEDLGPKYNAVVTITRDLALQQAREAEKEIHSGKYRGPLHGIPYGVKDALATGGGIPTTWGAKPLKDVKFDYDATVIRKLKEAGAILAAKLAMVELAGGMGYRQPNASFTGPGINPWDRNRWSGGSSSGSGSSVSAGLIPFAIGSETWGSILIPANHCGVSGLRPTYGIVSRRGAMVLSWSLDKIGPMCLTADDCGIVLEAIAGADELDPSTGIRGFRYETKPIAKRYKLGVIPAIAERSEESVRRNFEAAIGTLASMADIQEVNLPDRPYEEITRTILFAEMASAFEDFIESGRIGELTAPEDRWTPYSRLVVLAKDYIRALRLRGIVAQEVDHAMAKLDALVAPTCPIPATKLDEDFRSIAGGLPGDVMGAIGNAAGLPSISVPNGFSKEGLPTGIQFMGKAYDDQVVIDVARAYQSLTDWHSLHPPVPMT